MTPYTSLNTIKFNLYPKIYHETKKNPIRVGYCSNHQLGEYVDKCISCKCGHIWKPIVLLKE
jgi:hypothetical protein